MNESKRGWFENMYDTSMVKWFLPLCLWKRITEFLLPEDNIKLSLVTHSEHTYLLKNKGEFLVPPRAIVNRSMSPTWYSRNKFVLNFESWNQCSPQMLDRYFNCIVNLEVAKIDGHCAQLPLKNIFSLLQQSETTLKELSIVTFPRFNENTSFYQPCSDGSMNILRLIEPFDTFNNKKKMFKLQKLKSLHIQGPFALLWMQILKCIDMRELTHLFIELPSVSDVKNSSDLREIKKIITVFLFDFPKGQQFHLSVTPNDTTMYMIMRHCIAWIGSGSPSSKSFQFVKLESSNLNPILDSLKSHFYWILMKLNCSISMLNNIKLFLFAASEKFNDLCLKDDCKICKYLRNENVQHMLQLFDILRLNLNHLKEIEFIGPITTWESFVYVKAFLGPNVRLVVKNIQINIFNEWVSHVLYFTMENVVTLKLQASKSSSNNSMMFVNQNLLVNGTNDVEHINVECYCEYLGALLKKFYFRNLSKLILADVSLNSSQRILDLTSRLIVHNTLTFVEKQSMEASSHHELPLSDDSSTKTLQGHWNEFSGKENNLSLEIWFSEILFISDKNNKKIKTCRSKSIQKFYLEFVKRVITHFSVISVTIYPCPTISIFDEYHELLRASHYLIKNFTLEQTGNVSLYMTSKNHGNSNSHIDSDLPLITHLTLESFDAIQWILQFLIVKKYSYIFKNVQYLSINLSSETYIGLSLFFVDFLIKRNKSFSNINTFLDHSNLYLLINLFSNTLDLITITYHLPLMVHMIPTHVTSCFCLCFREELEKNLDKILHSNSNITMRKSYFKRKTLLQSIMLLNKGIQLNPLDSLYFFQFLQFMEDTMQLCDELLFDMTSVKQREFIFLYQHQQFCKKEKNLVPLLTQKDIDINTIKRNKFMTALSDLGVEIRKDSNEASNSNSGLIHNLQKSSSYCNGSESNATLYNEYPLRKQYPNLLCYIESLLQLLSEEAAVTQESLQNHEKEDESLYDDECKMFYSFMTHLENQLKKSFSTLLYYARQYDKMRLNYVKVKNVINEEQILKYQEKIPHFDQSSYKKNIYKNQSLNIQSPNLKENNKTWDFSEMVSSQFHIQTNNFKNTFHHDLKLESFRVDEINCFHWLPFQWNYHDSIFNKTILCQPDINGGKFTLTITRRNK